MPDADPALYGSDGPFLNTPMTRAAIDRLRLDVPTLLAFIHAVRELDYCEIVGELGMAEFRRGPDGRWAALA